MVAILGRVSVVAVIALVFAALLVILFVGGFIAARRRAGMLDEDLHRRVAEADRALEAARAADRGWDRTRLDEAARVALERERPDFEYDALHLVRVEDRPGKDEDRAHVAAVGDDERRHVVLVRRGDEWVAERVE